MRRPAIPSLLYVLGFVAALAALAPVSLRARAQEVTPASNATIRLLAIDADPAGNTATSLGPVDPCVRVEVGARFDVDVVVDAIPPERPLIAWQMFVRYDPQILEVVAVNKDFLIGATGDYQPLDAFSDPLPDSDGELREAYVDIASNSTGFGSNAESGPGIIMRVTMHAKAPGSSVVYLDLENRIKLVIKDIFNGNIGIDRVSAASVAVGQDCPPLAPDAMITEIPPSPTASPAPFELTPGPEHNSFTPSIGFATPDGASAPPAPAGALPTPVPAMAGLGSEDDGGASALAITAGSMFLTVGVSAFALGTWLVRQRRMRKPDR